MCTQWSTILTYLESVTVTNGLFRSYNGNKPLTCFNPTLSVIPFLSKMELKTFEELICFL